MRFIAQQPACFADIGHGLVHIALLHRQTLDNRPFSQIFLYRFNHPHQIDRFSAADVDNLIGSMLICDCGANSADNIVNVSVISLCRPVAKKKEWVFPRQSNA